MDNKLLGVIIIGFGLLILLSEQEYSWIFSALAVGLGTGLLIRKPEKDNIEKKMSKRIFIVYGHHNTKKCFNASRG